MIGTGPGSIEHLSQRAMTLLKKADCIAGYTTYMDLIGPVIKGKPTIATGMTKEVERVEKAIDKALSGISCALVSGGDAGIYAMAGLVFEMCQEKGIKLMRYGSGRCRKRTELNLEIEVVPGIPALAAGASLVGAPLTHDFCAISLSDLLTPWETIEKRLHAAASADFVIVLYNPKSKKRTWQLTRAVEIISEYRDGKVPVGVVTGAMREQQQVNIVRLKDLDRAKVGMQTVLFVGSTASINYLEFMYTPRGYAGKYALKKSGA